MYKSFIDTNLWIYVFSESEEDVSKRDKTITFLEELRKKSPIVFSVQVLNEFHSALQRKYKIEEEIIREYVSKGITGIGNVIPLGLQTYKEACRVRDKYNISYWDSIIVASALNSQCEILFSEDMHHNLEIENKLVIQDPLLQQQVPNSCLYPSNAVKSTKIHEEKLKIGPARKPWPCKREHRHGASGGQQSNDLAEN